MNRVNMTISTKKISNTYVIKKEMFSSFVEHLGRAVYTGIFEPGHRRSDVFGFREDVSALIRDLGVKAVRYPGGNFVSGYDWEDGVGKDRKRRLELAWRSIETNQFGTDEFMRWCKVNQIEPIMAVNLGTGTPQTAANLLAYCNSDTDTFYANMRRQNGNNQAYGVKYWCLGNEMDGPWQICHLNAEDYSKKALEAAKMMRWVDPDIKLIACGSSSSDMPTFPSWDQTVIHNLFDQIDYISMHKYYHDEGSLNDFFASHIDMSQFIETVHQLIKDEKHARHSAKDIFISFDEWNVWYQNEVKLPDWEVAPPILEDIFSLKDMLVFTSMLMTLMEHSDIVKIACLAQLVNVIAPILTEPKGKAIKQAIFFPFELMAKYGMGYKVPLTVKCDTFPSRYGMAPYVKSVAVMDHKKEVISLFNVNFDTKQNRHLEIIFDQPLKLEVLSFEVVTADDLNAKNTFVAPNQISVEDHLTKAKIDLGTSYLSYELPKQSWSVLRFKFKEINV